MFPLAVCDSVQEKEDGGKISCLGIKWVGAYKKRQKTAVGALLGEDDVLTGGDRNTDGKGGFNIIRRGGLHVDSADLTDVRIRMHENTAVVTAAYHERGELGGKSYDYHDRVTDVWMKSGGKWQLIVSHYSVPASI